MVDESIYQEHALKAQQRIKNRDLHDWPVIATALVVDSPIWTEDQDFFGSGISVWTTDRIHLFFEGDLVTETLINKNMVLCTRRARGRRRIKYISLDYIFAKLSLTSLSFYKINWLHH